MNVLKNITIKIEPRVDLTTKQSIVAKSLSVLTAIVVGGILLAAVGADPLETYSAMFAGAFGTPSQWLQGQFYNFSETLVKAIPITLTSLAVLVAFHMLFWNIGADGQFAIGASAATGVALFGRSLAPGIPEVLVVPIMILFGIAAGAAWGLIAAVLKLFFRVNEIISTLMLNYVAILFVEHLYFGPWQDPQGMGFPGTARFPEFARLPGLFGRVHLGLLFAIATAIMLWILLDFTTKGYEIKVIGRNREAARYAGIDLTHNTLLVVAISAGLAGLAGVSEVSGLAFRLQQGVLISYTSISIIVAWIANLRVWVAVLISVLIAALIVGGDQLQILFGLPSAVALVLQALLLFSILAGEFFIRYRIKLSRKPASVSEPASLLETR